MSRKIEKDPGMDDIKRWVVDHFIHSNPLDGMLDQLDDIFDSAGWDETGDGVVKGTIEVAVNGVEILPAKELLVEWPFAEDGDDCTEWSYSDEDNRDDTTKGNQASFQKRAKIAIRDYLIGASLVSSFAEHLDEILEVEGFREKLARKVGRNENSPYVHVEMRVNKGVEIYLDGFSISMIGHQHDF